MSLFKIIFGVLMTLIVLILFGVIESIAIDQSICSPKANVILYPNGSLKSCIPQDFFGSNEFKCNSEGPASFYDNGRIETCILAEQATLSGQKCNESDQISFYPDGKFRSCVKMD